MTRFILSVMLCLLCVATLHGQSRYRRVEPPPVVEELTPEPPPQPIIAPPPESSGIDSFVTGLLVLSLLAFIVVAFGMAVRFWVRYSPVADVRQLAMNDPWTRAYLEQRNAEDDSTLTDPGVGITNGVRREH
jgi:hypothetical protein